MQKAAGRRNTSVPSGCFSFWPQEHETERKHHGSSDRIARLRQRQQRTGQTDHPRRGSIRPDHHRGQRAGRQPQPLRALHRHPRRREHRRRGRRHQRVRHQAPRTRHPHAEGGRAQRVLQRIRRAERRLQRQRRRLRHRRGGNAHGRHEEDHHRQGQRDPVAEPRAHGRQARDRAHRPVQLPRHHPGRQHHQHARPHRGRHRLDQHQRRRTPPDSS